MKQVEREAWLTFYRERGLATIPLRPREKRPLLKGWRQPSVEAWARAPVDANVGILCGVASGDLVVLDFDTPDGLRDATCMRPEELAIHTLVARTARGWHVYARGSSVGTSSPWPGLDVRGEGSMVVAPPSVHPSGAMYEFVRADSPIATLSSLPISIPADRPADNGAVLAIDWPSIESWVALQAPKLRAHWALLKEPRGEFDRSRADFAVARCLWEAGHSAEDIAQVLLALPGSKARERGEAYARLTAARASGRQRS